MEGPALVRRNLRIFSFIGETIREVTAPESRSNFRGIPAAFIGGNSAAILATRFRDFRGKGVVASLALALVVRGRSVVVHRPVAPRLEGEIFSLSFSFGELRSVTEGLRSDLNNGEDLPIENAWTFTDTSRDF
jgi:hypothetical protein